MAALVSWENLQISYNNQLVVSPFDGVIHKGEKWAVLGPNGSGKSSWMKALMGLLPQDPVSSITWNQDFSKLSYAPQSLDFDAKLPIRLDEFLEISQANSLLQWPWPWISHRILIHKVAEIFELQNLLGRKLEQLSRGQVQKAILARTFLNRPSSIFFDEPLTGLDPASRKKVLHTIFSQVETIVMITHEADWQQLGFTHVLRFPDYTQEGQNVRPSAQSLS